MQPQGQQRHRRTPPQNPSNLRRRLFLDTQQQSNETLEDQEQLDKLIEEARVDNARNLAAQLLSAEKGEKTRKWNFDFETETPLEGLWEWEAVVEVAQQRGAESTGAIGKEGYCDSRGTNGLAS